MCEAVTVDIQTTSEMVDLYVLPIAGANVILRVQWLKSLDPVLTDDNALTMKFFHNGSLVELRGDKDTKLGMITPPQLRCLCHKPGNALCFHIMVIPEETSSSPITDLSPELRALLFKFSSLFQSPQSLPPTQDTDHHIHLLPQATSVNV